MENYNIYDSIGRGTHSFVYKARRKRSIEYVAVKSTAKSRMNKILNEVQILHKLDSRYVLKFYNWYESQNHIWIIFEYCIGGDLLNLITQDKQLPIAAVRDFGWELVAGLHYLHTNSILFCDIKPSNILIDECGSLKLADFGLARRIPTHESLNNATLGPGSPNYMAPELFLQPAIHSYASDFWALGCVLYELCTGHPPFTHTNFADLAYMIQRQPVELPTPGYEMPPEFIDLLTRLLDKDPYQRMTWNELVHHPFWNGLPALEETELPPQELFEASRRPDRISEFQTEAQSNTLDGNNEPRIKGASEPSNDAASVASKPLDGFNPSPNEPRPFSLHHGTKIINREITNGESSPPMERGNQSVSDSASNSDCENEIEDIDDDEVKEEMTKNGNGFDFGERRSVGLRPVTAPITSLPEGGHNHHQQHNEKFGEAAVKREKYIIPPRHAPQTAPPAPAKSLSNSNQRLRSRLPLKKPSRLLFTAADCVAKPVTFSDEIEHILSPTVIPDLLSFDVMSADQLLSCPTEALEDHLKNIYIDLKASDRSNNEKSNVLAYLISLSRHPKLANVIVNSSMLTLLIRLIQQTSRLIIDVRQEDDGGSDKPPLILQIALALGVLFRFAAFIAPTSPQQMEDLASTLSNIIQDTRMESSSPSRQPQERVYVLARRRTLSCLGELIFYMTTQKQYRIPAVGISCLIDSLEDSDCITKHYAVRTLANLLTHVTDHGLLASLLTERVMGALLRTLVPSLPSDDGIYEDDNHLDCDSAFLQHAQIHRTTASIQAIGQIARHLRSTPSTAYKLPRHTRNGLMLLLSKPPALRAVWINVKREEDRHTEVMVASLNVLSTFLDTRLDRKQDEAAYCIVEEHKRLLLERIVDLRVLISILDARCRHSDANTHAVSSKEGGAVVQVLNSPSHSESSKSSAVTAAVGKQRRYAGDNDALPELLRAKALLFVCIGIHHSSRFVQMCIQYRAVETIGRSLALYSSSINTPDCSSPRSTVSDEPTVPSSAASSSQCLSAFRHHHMSPLDQYVVQCGLNTIRVCIRTALKMSAECISASRRGTCDEEALGEIDQDTVNLKRPQAQHHCPIAAAPFQLFEQLLRQPTCRSQVVSYFLTNEGNEFTFFVRLMTKLLHSFPREYLAPMSDTVAAVVSQLLLNLFQGSSAESEALLSTEAGEIFTHLLPAVVLQLLSDECCSQPQKPTAIGSGTANTSSELKVNCIRLVYSIMMHVKEDPLSCEGELKDIFVDKQLLPCLQSLLTESQLDENVWRFTIELLYGLVVRTPEEMFKQITDQGLEKHVIALLSVPMTRSYQSLPSSATSLVKSLVVSRRNAHTLAALHQHGISQHVLSALEFSAPSASQGHTMQSSLDVLEILYHLLYRRYEELRHRARATVDDGETCADFKFLVNAGPIMLRCCAHASKDLSIPVQPEEHCPRKHTNETTALSINEVTVDVVDIASRCLIYLSQIFGESLNDVLFQSEKEAKDNLLPGTDSKNIARLILIIVQEQSCDSSVLLHVLLTLKNCLRCEAKTVSSRRSNNLRDRMPAVRWLNEHASVLHEVKQIAKARGVTVSSNGKTDKQEANKLQVQISKTAADILRLHQQGTARNLRTQQE